MSRDNGDITADTPVVRSPLCNKHSLVCFYLQIGGFLNQPLKGLQLREPKGYLPDWSNHTVPLPIRLASLPLAPLLEVSNDWVLTIVYPMVNASSEARKRSSLQRKPRKGMMSH